MEGGGMNACVNWAIVADGSTSFNFSSSWSAGETLQGNGPIPLAFSCLGTRGCAMGTGLLQHSCLACLIHQAHPAGCPICLYLSLGGERIAGVRLRSLGCGGLQPSAPPGGLRFVYKGRDFFVWLSIVTSPVLAPVLAWGSEQQPCSHTSCRTAKALHAPCPLQ